MNALLLTVYSVDKDRDFLLFVFVWYSELARRIHITMVSRFKVRSSKLNFDTPNFICSSFWNIFFNLWNCTSIYHERRLIWAGMNKDYARCGRIKSECCLRIILVCSLMQRHYASLWAVRIENNFTAVSEHSYMGGKRYFLKDYKC